MRGFQFLTLAKDKQQVRKFLAWEGGSHSVAYCEPVGPPDRDSELAQNWMGPSVCGVLGQTP